MKLFADTLALFCNTSSLVAYCMRTCCIVLYLHCLPSSKIFRKIFVSLIPLQHVITHCVLYADVLHSRSCKNVFSFLLNHFVLSLGVCRTTEQIVLCNDDATLCACELVVSLKTANR